MTRKLSYSHGFRPPLITLAVMIITLFESQSQKQAFASHDHCKQIGDVQRGFSLTVIDSNIKQFLNASKSIDDCIKLACKVRDANYAVFDSGKCHALRCKKNACKISEDVKSKQTFVGLARQEKKHRKVRSKNVDKRRKKGGKHEASSASKEKTDKNLQAVSKDTSNWTIALSTVVVPLNKTNPAIANSFDSKLKLLEHERQSLQIAKHSDKHAKKSSKRKHKIHASKKKQRTSKKSRKTHPKLHRKHTKRRLKKVVKTSHAIISNHSKKVHNTTERFTRDYPYSYSQYQYGSPDSSYATQETDWRRNMVPTSDDSYSDYDAVDRQSSSRSQIEQSPIVERSKLGENSQLYSPVSYASNVNDNSQLFSLPIANLVRRTDIPHGSHQVSSISIINDMLPDDASTKSYGSINAARDVIPTDLASRGVGVYGDDSALSTDASAGLSGYKVKSVVSRPEEVAARQPVNMLADLTGTALKSAERQQPAALSESYAAEPSEDVSQQAVSAYPGYKDSVVGNDYADTSYAIGSQGVPLSEITDQRIKNDNINLIPTADPLTKPPQKQNLVIVGIANHTAPSITKAMFSPAEAAPDLAKTGAAPAVSGLVKTGAAPTVAAPPSEPELSDPDADHVAISKGMYNGYMKKIANLTTFANVLPAKEIASITDDVPIHDDLHATPVTTSASSVTPASSSLPVASSANAPMNSLLTVLGKVAASNTLKEASTGFDPIQTLALLSSSSSPSAFRLSPSASTPSYPQVLATGTPVTKPQPNDIDAPLQNNIIPVGKIKEVNNFGQPVESTMVANLVKSASVLPVDLPFPARLVLPAPSGGLSQPLSGLSTVFYSSSTTAETEPNKPTVITAPTPLFSPTPVGLLASGSSTATGRLITQPTFTADFNVLSSVHSLATGQTNNAKPGIEKSFNILPSRSTIKDSIPPSDIPDVESPSIPTQKVTQITEQPVGPTEEPAFDATTNIPMTDEPTHHRTTAKPTLAYSSKQVPDDLLSKKNITQQITYKQTSLKIQKAAILTQNTHTDIQNLQTQLSNSTLTSNSKPQHAGAHIIPGSAASSNDDTLKHISPISKPKLKLEKNGSVVVLNDAKANSTQKPGIFDVFGNYQLEAKLRAELRTKQIQLLKSGKGCSEPLGVSTGAIHNSQISASSQQSPLFAPARARLGLQSDMHGNAGGWCADPTQNEHLQYLQIDFRGIKDVCRIAMQGLFDARSWVTYYKVAFSTNRVNWSVYKEGGKDKVLQGNIEQDDWTSYRLIDPIRARFIRIIPQAWEGKSICLRTELYGESTGGESSVHGRSNIPTALQGMINHLTFEKIDDVIVFDSSSMGNNAYLNQGAAVYDTHGKCRHAARIGQGSDVLLDGRNMRVKPREAISISVWVRVDKTEGVHSIFDTVGANSNHVLGQYHFEIVGGAVRWFHRDENGTQIFSAITEPNFINPREWTHLVVTYEASSGDTKIYVNGSRVTVSKGKGLLSQDWAGRVGIGRHKDTRDLLGDLDEFRIYSEVIQGEKIMALSRECDFEKYYCGSLLTAERGMLITPDYPAVHRGPVRCIWDIKGLPGEVIALDVKEFDMKNCNKSKLIIRDAANDTLIGSYCGEIKPGRIESHGSQMRVEFTSDGFGDGERFKIEFQREKKRASKKTMSSICKNSDLYQNVTLVGGSKAGTYTDLGKFEDMKACQEKCCEKETCEIAFMIDGNCYAVRCFDQDLCKIRKAKASSLSPMLSFISREGIPTRILPVFVEKPAVAATKPVINAAITDASAAKPEGKGHRKHCQSSVLHHNSTLVRGMKSGNFTSRGIVENFDQCFGLCCQTDNCDAAFMVKRTCFSVQCYSKESCSYKAARPSSFNPTLAYVLSEKTNEKIEDSQGAAKSSVTISGSCAKSRVSKIYRNITLRDGVNAGEFTDRGNVGTMDHCLKHCCSDENCNLAFVIKQTCFTVKCKNYDACSLKSAVSKYYNPRIAYVNWSPPKENLGEGDIRYDYQGCWKDFDMSAFALPLLEGTDPVLSGPYKKRADPVNDCATVSQNRGYAVFAIQNGGACFSGGNTEATYKRYGPSDACKGGRGGAFANSVYKLFEDGSVMSLGCWADLQDRAFRRLEKIDPSLQDSYVNRANPIDVCAKVAKSHNTNTFALQKGGQCFIGKGDKPSYERYGPSRKCKYGLGGQMANDVYFVQGVGNPAGKTTENNVPQHALPVKPTLRNTTVDEKPVLASVSDAVATTATTTNATSPTTAATTPTTPKTTPTTPATKTTPTTPTNPTTQTTPTTPTTHTTQTTPVSKTTPTTQTTPATKTTPTTPTTPTTKTTPATTASNAISKSDAAKTGPVTDTGDLKPGETVYKEELTDTEHVKFIYSSDAVIPNVTISSGINAGTFTDKGAMENMDDCVRSCGETSNCDLAFKLGKQCFGVACYGKNTCSTKPAFSTFYNPLIAYVKHRTIRTQRKKEEAQIDSNPTQRSLCKAKNNAENVTLVDGIGAGNFTDLGHVANMDDCISRCCADSACELAFKIEDDCYGVTCYSEKSCRTRAARNAMVLRPKIAFVRDVGSRNVLDSKAVAKSEKQVPKPENPKQSTCSPDVWEGDIQENVTLVGGVNAGEFTDHGQAETFGACMSFCCDSKDCDLAFMIDNDCYGVKCKDPNHCKTRTARPTKYRPMIGFKKSVETGVETEIIPVLSISNTMFKDRTPIEDTSKNIDGNRFEARAYYTPLTTSSTNKLTNVTTTAKPTVTVIPRPPRGTTPALSSTSVKSTYSATPTYGDPTSKHSCEAGSIIYNATLKMGMHSGLFTKLGRVSKMDDCIERCCKSSNADVAFMLGFVCFAVKCYNSELCKTAPAMISNIGNLNMNPTLSFLKKKEATMTSGNDIDVIIDEISDKIDEPDNKQLTAYNGLFASLENISTVWEVHERARPIPRMPALLTPGAACTDSPITYNVTLKGGIHAGNFTNQGEGLTPRECIGKCCDRKACDVAFMFAELCYSVKCKTDDDCQAVVAKPSGLSPKVAYVTRNKIPTDRETMFDVTTSSDDDHVCDDANLEHSPIQSNRTLIGGLNAGNFSYLGKTKTMRECLGKCCSARKCDVAYRIDRECFSVKCFSPDLCQVSDAPAKNGFVQFATMSNKKDLRRINQHSIAIYVMIGVLCFTVGISGLGWVMCIFLKKRRQRNQQQQTDADPMPDR